MNKPNSLPSKEKKIEFIISRYDNIDNDGWTKAEPITFEDIAENKDLKFDNDTSMPINEALPFTNNKYANWIVEVKT